MASSGTVGGLVQGTGPVVPASEEPSVSRQFLARLARGALLALTLQVLGAGLGYLSQVAFARWMGVSQFGMYTYMLAWATILALLAGLGFPLSVLRLIPAYRAKGDHARLRGVVHLSRRAAGATGLAVAVIGTAIALTVLSGFSATVALVAVWLVPTGSLINVDSSIIRAQGRVIAAYAPSLALRPFLILLGTSVVWLAVRRVSATTGMLITLSVFVSVALLQWKFVRGTVRTGAAPYAVLYEPRAWLSVSAPLLLVAGFQIALTQSDLLVVGAVKGVGYAGLYAAASKSAALVGYLLVSLNAVTAPLFSEFEARGDTAGLQRLASISAQWVFWPTLAIAACLAWLAPFVLGLFGSHFTAASGALRILLVGQLVSAGCGAVGYLLSMTGHQKDMAKVYGIMSVLNIGVCYAGTLAYGLSGAAWATTISFIAWNIWLHRLTVRRIGVRASILSSLALRKEQRD